MKRICTTAAALLMLGDFALAQDAAGLALTQTTGGTSTGGPASPGAAISGQSGTMNQPPTNDATVPIGTTLPGGSPAPSDSATTGQGPGADPANPQDMLGRDNPQDLTTPQAKNPQDRKIPGAPQIVAPER